MKAVDDQKLKSFARISAWALLVTVIVLLISGWGITQTGLIYNASLGLIDRKLANYIHRASNIPLAFFFLAHVMINIKLVFSRRHCSIAIDWLINSLMLLIAIGVMIMVVYLEYFRLGG